jgi:hypothetical protein
LASLPEGCDEFSDNGCEPAESDASDEEEALAEAEAAEEVVVEEDGTIKLELSKEEIVNLI